MASAPLDFSSLITVSSAVMSEVYSYTVPSGKVLLLQEMSLAGDSNFLTNGRFLLRVGNDVVTSQGDNTNEVPMLRNFTWRLPDIGASALVVKALQAGEQIKVFARATTGSATMQVQMQGLFISPEQWEQLKAKGVIPL